MLWLYTVQSHIFPFFHYEQKEMPKCVHFYTQHQHLKQLNYYLTIFIIIRNIWSYYILLITNKGDWISSSGRDKIIFIPFWQSDSWTEAKWKFQASRNHIAKRQCLQRLKLFFSILKWRRKWGALVLMVCLY